MLAVAGCPKRGGDPHADADADAHAHAHADADAHADAAAHAHADPAPFLTGRPVSAKSIGHTSVVFKIELSTGKKAVFKPASRRGPLRYKGEIAAYRLGQALLIDNVPPAYFRTFDAKELAGAMKNEDSAALFAKEAIVDGGIVKGAIMPWIDGLDFVALERAPLSTQWKAWLAKDGRIAPEDRTRAMEISSLVAFDFVTGNWDRWSGGNVGLDPTTKRLLFIDNDGAFFDVPPLDGLARNEKLLRGVDKLSRSFVEALERLDDEALARVLGDEASGAPLLGPKAFAGVVARRKKLLEILHTKMDAGDELFWFP